MPSTDSGYAKPRPLTGRRRSIHVPLWATNRMNSSDSLLRGMKNMRNGNGDANIEQKPAEHFENL